MTAVLEIEPLVVPLRTDDTGTVRVGHTRVTLDVVVRAHDRGETVADIVDRFDTLTEADVHATLAYVMHHRGEVDEYLKRRERRAEESRQRWRERFDQTGVKAELLARREAGKGNRE
jgi:uncharacterized protein (DUF433 family)